MAEDACNDDARVDTLAGAAEANGQAAILLVESLIHGLISKSVLSVTEVVEIIEVAADVTSEIAVDEEGSDATAGKSFTLLSAIAQSLKHDIG